MMMTSRNKRITPGVRKVLMLLGVLILLFALGYVARSAATSVLLHPAVFVWKGTGWVGEVSKNTFAFFKSKASLVTENAELRSELARREAMLLDRNLLYEENLELKERLGRIAHPNAVLAAVLLHPPHTPYDSLLIDAGEEVGIRVGDTVVAHGSVRIGAVTEVYADMARVDLYSAPNTTYDGFLRGTIPVTVEGQGGGSLVMIVPYDAQVAVGDTVSLPGIESNFAFTVDHVDRGEGDSATHAFMRLPINPSSLKAVEVWRSGE